jgi:uncharacterized protein YciI
MPVFAVRYDYVNDEAGLDKHRQGHRDFLKALAENGTLRASGPFGADGGSRGALLLFRGRSAGAIRKMLAADPFATAGLIKQMDVREWAVVTGPIAGAIAEGS